MIDEALQQRTNVGSMFRQNLCYANTKQKNKKVHMWLVKKVNHLAAKELDFSLEVVEIKPKLKGE